MKYKIIDADSKREFEEKVNREIANGWKLQGGVSIRAYDYEDDKYYQAMVKE